LFTQDLEGENNGLIPVNLAAAAEKGYSAASSSRFGSSIIDRQDIIETGSLDIQELVEAPLNPTYTQLEKFSNTNFYNPIMYLGAALGFRVSALMNLSVEWSVFLARLINAVPFFAISFLALFVLRSTKVRWLVFFVLLLPTVISYVATINGDPYNIAVVMLFFAVFIKYINKQNSTSDRNFKILTIGSILLLAFAKLPSVVLAVLAVLLPDNRFEGRKNKWIIITGIAVLSALITFSPTLFSAGGEYDNNVRQQLNWVIQNPFDTLRIYAHTLFVELPDYLSRAIGIMGRNGVFVYPVAITISLVWLVLLGLWLDKGSKKIALATALIGLLSCFMIMTFLFVLDNKPGTELIWGVHGKYFTPFIPFILYGLTALPISVVSKGRHLEYGTVTISVFVLFVSVVMYNTALY
jgi:uncharacterized membrane protein